MRSDDHYLVDAALRTLPAATGIDDRFAVLETLVEYWHGPISSADGLSDEALADYTMPDTLKRWYRWAGRRETILSGQNWFFGPDRLRMEDGRLCFYVENQGVYFWATLPDGEDPPTFGRFDERDPWQPEGMTLSEHLMLACLFEAIMCHAPYRASHSWLDRNAIERIAEVIPAIPLPPWRGWFGTRFYGQAGAFMHVMSGPAEAAPAGGSIWIGARTREPLLFLHGLGVTDWDYVAI